MQVGCIIWLRSTKTALHHCAMDMEPMRPSKERHVGTRAPVAGSIQAVLWCPTPWISLWQVNWIGIREGQTLLPHSQAVVGLNLQVNWDFFAYSPCPLVGCFPLRNRETLRMQLFFISYVKPGSFSRYIKQICRTAFSHSCILQTSCL